ncbi:MAG TPA: sugar-binding protein [bacterium]|nr:sugar-binding protein [bacterium]
MKLTSGFPPNRRHALTAIFIGSFVLTLAVSSSAQTPRPEIFVPYLDTTLHPIVIDGSSSDWPAESLAHGVNFYPGDANPGSSTQYGTTVLGTMSGRADGEVTIYLTHDGNSLYLLAVIYDDLLEQRTSENNANEAWKEDALHIYIDSTNAQRANIPDPPIGNQPGYEQFGVSTDYNCYTENCDFTTLKTARGVALCGARPDQEHWLASIQITGTGPYTYIFEERIPLQEVAGHNLRTMTPGQSYGFNAEFVDSDAGVYLQGWMFWSGNGRLDVWNYESMWGRMTLEETPPIPSDTGNWDLYR